MQNRKYSRLWSRLTAFVAGLLQWLSGEAPATPAKQWFKCEVLADSVNPVGCRLTTLEVTFPRFILAEFNTHRMLSRNAASSRAIPTKKLLYRVWNDPFVPFYIGLNQAGMQAQSQVRGWRRRFGVWLWRTAAKVACVFAWLLLKLGWHKQLANRVLEPWLWVTVIVSATDWGNFFGLRCHPAAQPEFRWLARMMRDALALSIPKHLHEGDWHVPFAVRSLSNSPTSIEDVKAASGRCARVSYLTHDGRFDVVADLRLHDDLQVGGHMSPFEHCAQALGVSARVGNFKGWCQYRKLLLDEDDFSRRPPHQH